jgi:hypothetical protein
MLSLCQKHKVKSIAIPDVKNIYHMSIRDIFLNECKGFIERAEEKFFNEGSELLHLTKIFIMCDNEEEVKLYEQSI